MKAFTIGILSGLVAGLVLGILYAPGKGSDTRKIIAEKDGELTEGIKQRFHEFGDFVSEKLDSTKGIYSQFIRMGKANA